MTRRVFVLLSTPTGTVLAEFLGPASSGLLQVRRCRAGARRDPVLEVEASEVVRDPVKLGRFRLDFLRIEAEQGRTP